MFAFVLALPFVLLLALTLTVFSLLPSTLLLSAIALALPEPLLGLLPLSPLVLALLFPSFPVPSPALLLAPPLVGAAAGLPTALL